MAHMITFFCAMGLLVFLAGQRDAAHTRSTPGEIALFLHAARAYDTE